MEHTIVVLVDEDREFDSIIKMKLESEGFAVHVADMPQMGMRMIEEIQPDLVLLDINMPGMSGIEFITELKENPAAKTTKVAFFSSMIDPWKGNGDIQSVAEKLGAIAFIDKAIDLDKLVEQVGELIAAPKTGM
ncbi:MAG: two-component system response regulator (Ntr family) [Candidatus Wolfebacteria bacterium GW2011_GWE1_48_7]|uniref:Two-component system response regulator (Ntr family) n=2 Tax=Candidatus Wolfeibacteriota TaxID=1752735 RepID=A0A0G1WGX6_9BACT|nr:MAG: Fis family two component transcriptional regulator [Candidatus Wolfebacteria bacterium GW2011_GWB1_47_1]KKU36441.1 MAG: two-component system response regulator (Ntr family) [Candidatus Wolfebacteria bacterium GW2011_GWC2_46_275]KKU41754.1 MAG: two-component system response regulator (Ntr family) [Candidatus Wolfebacteria bacterium GW2011_GWB2_46_69]KKU53952.1 MAG: two-component system response regulator (Ntr family) [Candidatus Wolfebacteria bacterium GW2011_GWC1_47_103]KKU59028.1 MAG: 